MKFLGAKLVNRVTVASVR